MLDVRFADTGGDELFTISPRRLLPLVMLVLGLGGGFVGMAGTYGVSCPVAGQYMAGGGACAIVASVCSVASWLWLDGKSAAFSLSKTGTALAIIGTAALAFAAALTIDAGLMLFTLLADAQTCFVKDPGSGGLAPAPMVKALGLPAGLMILSCVAVLAQLARAAAKAMCGDKGARKATGASENTGLLARLKLFAGGEAEPSAEEEEEARGACGVAAPTGRGALDLLLICTVVGLLAWAMFFVIAHAGGGGICPVSDVSWHCGTSGEGESSGRTLLVRPQWQKPYEVEIDEGTGSHGGGDVRMLADIFGDPSGEEDPWKRAACHIDGARSILTGIAANASFATGQPVRVDDLVRLP